MKTHHHHIYFEKTLQKPRISEWACKFVKTDKLIGMVKWSANYLSYCFYPEPNCFPLTIGTCYIVSQFMKELYDSHKHSCTDQARPPLKNTPPVERTCGRVGCSTKFMDDTKRKNKRFCSGRCRVEVNNKKAKEKRELISAGSV